MSFSPVLAFARKELAKYLDRLSVKAEIALGLFAEFGLSCEVHDPYFDDAFSISVQNGHGYIAGSNERSVLIGVYRLLADSVRVAWECEDEVQGALDCMFYGDMMYDHLNLDGPKAFDDF